MRELRNRIYRGALIVAILLQTACSTTSHIPEEEFLYTGIKKLSFSERDKSTHGSVAEEEVEAVLSYAPNNSLMGSSSHRFPLPLGLWMWNSLVDNHRGMFKKWLFNTFATSPVYISTVNPDVRTQVARNTLANYGYFDGDVTSVIVEQKNPKKRKISYNVRMGAPYTYDSVSYVGFHGTADSIVRSSIAESDIRVGDAFNVTLLEEERVRLSNILRNNGYFYFKSDYLTFLADTVHSHGHVSLRMNCSALPSMASRQWHIGNMTMRVRRSSTEQTPDTLRRRMFKYIYKGEKIPIRAGALFRNFSLRRGELFSLDAHNSTISKVNQMGLFSQVSLKYVPRDTVQSDTLDMVFDAVLDMPLEVELSANVTSKSNDQIGPGMTLAFTKKNAFRAGEKLSLKLTGSYEWQTNSSVKGSSSVINSYSYGATGVLEFPRIIFPWFNNRRFRLPSSTTFSLQALQENRAGYFRMVSLSSGVTYALQSSTHSRHEFSPLSLTFNMLQSTTSKFDSITSANKALYISMRDQFIPAMRYTYTYNRVSLRDRRDHLFWQVSVAEAGNVLSAAYALGGHSVSKQNKTIFGNPYSQFIKLSSELRRTFPVGEKSSVATRLMAGVVFSYGNSSEAPFSEQFYVGGANSIRAFTIRSVGPGRYLPNGSTYSYIDETGDMKIEANVEYRFPLVGSLNGALFLDAGNVWLMNPDSDRPGGTFRIKNIADDIALGTGFGLRYDMDFIVLRLDLGIGIHTPYETGKKGYYNIPKFKDGLGFHFAIGYPF